MIRLINFLIIIGITLTSFTTLRIGFIGPSEFILFLAILLIFINNKGNLVIFNNIYIWFWVIFLLSICISTIVSFVYSGAYRDDVISELIAYLFTIGLIISYYTHFSKIDKKQINNLLYRFYQFNSFLFILIYLYSLKSNTFLGFNLFYGERLSMFSENPHQLSLYIGVIIFLGLIFIRKQIISKNNLLIFINTVFLIIIGVSTLSTTFYVSLIISIFVSVSYSVIKMIHRDRTRIYIIIIYLLILTLILVNIYIFRFDIIYNIFANDENGLGRLWLWKEAINYSIDNLFFGYGFGTVIEIDSTLIDTSEAHNIILDILLKGGILSSIVFISLMFYTIYKVRVNSVYLGLVFFIFIYSMAGFTLKRVILWFVIIILNILVEKSIKELRVKHDFKR